MNDTITGPTDEDLERALRALADAAPSPGTALSDDLRRGRRGLRRRHAATGLGSVAGVTLAVGAVLAAGHALAPGPSTPVASASTGGVVAGVAGSPTPTMTGVPDASSTPASTPTGPPAIAGAVVRHLDPQGDHHPGGTADYEHSSASDRRGTTSASTTVPWVKADHRATTGVTVRVMRDEGPQCAAVPGELSVPTCRTVRLGGVAVTKVTFARLTRAPEYWRQNAKGTWVAVDVFRVDDAFVTDPDGSSDVDIDPLPELGIDEQAIGPLLADPALDVVVLDG